MRLRVALATTVIALLAASPASATDYCVAPDTSCAGADTFTDIQDALNAATLNPGPDRVLIGAGEFAVPTGGFTYDALDAVDIRGAGPTATLLHQPDRTPAGPEVALTVRNGSLDRATVSGLGVRVGGQTMSSGGSNAALVLGTTVDASDIRVTAAPGEFHLRGVELEGTATLSSAEVDLRAAGGAPAAVITTDPSATAVVTDSTLRGFHGATAGPGSLVVRRTEVSAAVGLYADHGSLVAENVLVRLSSEAPRVTGVHAGWASTITVSNSTIAGDEDTGVVGVTVRAEGSDPSIVHLEDSIVHTNNAPLSRVALGSGPANITVERTGLGIGTPLAENRGPGRVTYIDQPAPARPRFVGDPELGEFRLAHDSPHIDRGARDSQPPEDLEGDPRVVDGDGDGEARADLGAFEYQRQAPQVSASASPGSGQAGIPFTWSAAAIDPDGDPLTYAWSWDDGRAGSGQTVTHAFSALGAHTGTATVTDATGQSASSTTTVGVDPPPPAPATPAPGAAPAEVDRRGPSFSILRRGLRLSRTNLIPVRVSCAASEREPCAGTLTLASSGRVAPGRKTLQLGRAPFSVAPDRSAIVRVRVSRRNARIARRLGKVRVTAVGVARDAAGNEATVRRSATLVAGRTRR